MHLFFAGYALTLREQEICQYILENKNNNEIAEKLFISIGTVKTHTHNIYQKVGVSKRAQLVGIYQEFLDSYSKGIDS